MADTLIMFAMLVLGTVLIAYIALLGRLTSRAVFVVMVTATLTVCSLTLLADSGSFLLPYVALSMAGVALVLAVIVIVLLVLFLVRSHSGKETERGEDSPGTGLES